MPAAKPSIKALLHALDAVAYRTPVGGALLDYVYQGKAVSAVALGELIRRGLVEVRRCHDGHDRYFSTERGFRELAKAANAGAFE